MQVVPVIIIKIIALSLAFSSCSAVGTISREPEKYQHRENKKLGNSNAINILHMVQTILSLFIRKSFLSFNE